MAKIRELQPAHKSDKVTVGEAARAFKKVQGSSQKRDTGSSVQADKRYVRRDGDTGRFVTEQSDASEHRPQRNGRVKPK
jgi:hypothetical protein